MLQLGSPHLLTPTPEPPVSASACGAVVPEELDLGGGSAGDGGAGPYLQRDKQQAERLQQH